MTASTSPFVIPVAGATFVRPLVAGDGVRLYGSSSGSVGLKPAAAAGSVDFTLPTSAAVGNWLSDVNGVLSVETGAALLTRIAGASYTGGDVTMPDAIIRDRVAIGPAVTLNGQSLVYPGTDYRIDLAVQRTRTDVSTSSAGVWFELVLDAAASSPGFPAITQGQYALLTGVATASGNNKNYNSLYGQWNEAFHRGTGTVNRLYASYNVSTCANGAAANHNYAGKFETYGGTNSYGCEVSVFRSPTIGVQGAGTTWGYYASVQNLETITTGTDETYGFAAFVDRRNATGGNLSVFGYWSHLTVDNAGSGTLNSYDFYADARTGAGAGDNDYYLWFGTLGTTTGVYRIKTDGVMAYYNPGYATPYTPGSTDFERVVQQWVGNVCQYGTEKGSTGGTLRELQLLGANLVVPKTEVRHVISTSVQTFRDGMTVTDTTPNPTDLAGVGGGISFRGQTASFGDTTFGAVWAEYNATVGVESTLYLMARRVGGGNEPAVGVGSDGSLRIYEPPASGAHYTAFKSQAQAGNITYTWPAADGAGQLTSNGSGTLTWTASAGSGDMLLGTVQVVTALKTFGAAGAVSKFALAGTTSGSTVIDASAVASGTITIPAATDTLVGKATSDVFTNKTFDTAGAGNSFSINSVAVTANTGTGAVARAAGPVFTTPTLGAALATSIATSAASPLLLTNGQLVTVALTSQTVAGTTLTIPDFASVADEFVFKTKSVTLSNKTFVAPVLGAATANSINKVAVTAPATSATLTIADGKTLTASNTITFTATDGSTLAIGTGGTLGTAAYTAASAYATPAGTETLTNKRITQRVVALSTSASVTVQSDNADLIYMPCTEVAGTLAIANDTGTPTNGQKLILKIKCTNAQTYSFDARYVFSTTNVQPVTAPAGKTDYLGFIYDTVASKWHCVAVSQGSG